MTVHNRVYHVNYPRPKGHGLVTAQSYERLTSPTFNPNRYCYLKWRYIIGWLTTPFVTKFTLLQLYQVLGYQQDNLFPYDTDS